MVGRLLAFSFILVVFLPAFAAESDLTFAEIQSFTQSKAPDPDSFARFNRILHTAYGETNKVTNAEFKSKDEYQYLRVTDWNIERGFKLQQIKAIVSDESDPQFKEEIDLLRDTDIFTLNEVDWGIQRTGYRNIAKEFAEIFNANYLFVPEFLELSPSLLEDPDLDKTKYKGLHGNAIISKFPIVHYSILRLPLCYDWFMEENKELQNFEKLRRSSSSFVINEEIISELRQGSRVALVADIELPNKDIVTVISTHLENRTKPKCREKQIKKILNYVEEKDNAVVLAGDLNNFEASAEPTSVKKVIKNKVQDPNFMAKLGINLLVPVEWFVNLSASAIGFVRKHRNPTKLNIPVISPNKTAKLFSIIKDFEFEDGNHFDLAGDGDWSFNNEGSLGKYSNSNQIARKGYVETFKFKRAFGIAKYKIDWIFVKPGRNIACSGKFHKMDYDCKHYFPAFGRTLKDLNEHYAISDHHPITVELVL